MSSEMMVGYKRSASDTPDTSDDDGSQPDQGEARKLRQRAQGLERQRTKKLRRDGKARNLLREEPKMTVIMWQIEKAVRLVLA